SSGPGDMPNRASASWTSKTFCTGRGDWFESAEPGADSVEGAADNAGRGVATDATRVAAKGLWEDFKPDVGAGAALGAPVGGEPKGRVRSRALCRPEFSPRQTSVPTTKTSSAVIRGRQDARFR